MSFDDHANDGCAKVVGIGFALAACAIARMLGVIEISDLEIGFVIVSMIGYGVASTVMYFILIDSITLCPSVASRSREIRVVFNLAFLVVFFVILFSIE